MLPVTAAPRPISEADAASRQRTPACRSPMIRRQFHPVSGQAANYGIALDGHLSSAKGRSLRVLRRRRFSNMARLHPLQWASVDLEPANPQGAKMVGKKNKRRIRPIEFFLQPQNGETPVFARRRVLTSNLPNSLKI